jgi:quercetin 2,3-dioxygenase
VDLISGRWEDAQGAFQPHTDVQLNTIYFKPGGKLDIRVPLDRNIFFYVIRGQLDVNGTGAKARQLVEFHNDAEELRVEGAAESILLFGHVRPLNEPVVAHGPFVMNTEEEIREAYNDYRQGKFGTWQ